MYQQSEYYIFGGGQFNRKAVPGDFPGRKIHFHLAKAVDWLIALPAICAPDRCSQSRQKFRRVKRLGHIIIRSAIQRFHFIHFSVVYAQYDNRSLSPFPQTFQNLYAIHIGKAQVEHDDVIPLLRSGGYTIEAIGDRRDAITIGLQGNTQQALNLCLIINDKH